MLTYKKKDWLLTKTNDPVPVGGRSEGFLIFRFDRAGKDMLKDSKFTVTWRDVFGNTYSASGTTGAAASFGTFPGMDIGVGKP